MDRTKYIGSSDARDILAGSWDRLYAQKTGLAQPEDLSDNFKVQFGAFTEPFHIDWTMKRLNGEAGPGYLADKGPGDQHFSSFQPKESTTGVILGSHPDALIRTPAGLVYPMEVKHTGRFRSADEAAEFYMPQLQHHLIAWGADRLLFSVIIGNEEPERLWVGASADWALHYIERCDAFWRCVQDRNPPAPLLMPEEPLVPRHVSDTVPLNGYRKYDMSKSNAFRAAALEYIETKDAVKRHEKAKVDIKNAVPADAGEVYSDLLCVKRDKRGAIRMTVNEENAA